MNLFTRWIKYHPLKAVAFLIIGGVGSGALLALNHVAAGFVLLAFCYTAFVITYTLDVKRWLAIAVAASFLAVPRTHAQQKLEPAAPYIIGGVVILVAAGLGAIGCRIVKRCKKIARARGTNSEPDEMFLPAGEAPEYGAVFTWPEPGTCYEQRLLPSTPTVFTMCPVIDGSATRTLVHADVGEEFTQTWDAFKEELWGHGLALPITPTSVMSYEVGGHPCEAQQCPITFNASNHVATIGAGGVLVSVEKSEDLKTWEPLMSVNVEPWMNLRFEDASEDKAFYRVTTKEP